MVSLQAVLVLVLALSWLWGSEGFFLTHHPEYMCHRRWSAVGGIGDEQKPGSVWELLDQPRFDDIRMAFSDWTQDTFRGLDRDGVVALFSPNSTLIGKGLLLLREIHTRRLLPDNREGVKTIRVHEAGINDTDSDVSPSMRFEVATQAALDQILKDLGTAGLVSIDVPDLAIREVNKLANNTAYWLYVGDISPISKLRRASVKNEGWQANYEKAWIVKVNKAIPSLFERENYTLVQQPFKHTGEPYNCEMDGFFIDFLRRTVVVVEGKSGAMDISKEDEDSMLSMSHEQLRELRRRGYADAQLLATISAIKWSTSPQMRYFRDMTFIPVLAPWHLSPENEERARAKRGVFRLVRPDGSGVTLE